MLTLTLGIWLCLWVHSLAYLWAAYHIVHPCLVCLQSGEAVKELYSQLGEKLEQLDHRKTSPTQAAETPALELPLPSVPTTAAL